ncbi:hypothetical protein HKD37_08G022957 [Glycine soja]
MTGPLDESISCFLIKVDPWVLVPITFRGLYVLAIRGLHILACKGLHALAFRGLRVLIFSVLHIHTLREYKDFTRAAAKRRVRIMRINMTTLIWISMTLLFSNILPSDHNVNLPLQMNRAHKMPSGPEEVQQGPGGSRLQDTQWTRRSPTGSWSCQALITGLCDFYGVPVAPSKVIRPPTNPAFIKKYCVPRQAQGETP